jgi:hypothetical protein
MVASARRSFSCTISDSIRRSDSSSRSRWVSILRPSRSCSPILTSSSIMTARSMDTLYFDSTSSSDDVWWRAWRSKSSLCTSMSRSFIWSVRCWSRSAVISFCRAFCALLASVLLCLYLVCGYGEQWSCGGRRMSAASDEPSTRPPQNPGALPSPAACALASRSPPHRAQARLLAPCWRPGTPAAPPQGSHIAPCSKPAPLVCCPSPRSAERTACHLRPWWLCGSCDLSCELEKCCELLCCIIVPCECLQCRGPNP